MLDVGADSPPQQASELSVIKHQRRRWRRQHQPSTGKALLLVRPLAKLMRDRLVSRCGAQARYAFTEAATDTRIEKQSVVRWKLISIATWDENDVAERLWYCGVWGKVGARAQKLMGLGNIHFYAF
jgi:hypothetical protein